MTVTDATGTATNVKTDPKTAGTTVIRIVVVAVFAVTAAGTVIRIAVVAVVAAIAANTVLVIAVVVVVAVTTAVTHETTVLVVTKIVIRTMTEIVSVTAFTTVPAVVIETTTWTETVVTRNSAVTKELGDAMTRPPLVNQRAPVSVDAGRLHHPALVTSACNARSPNVQASQVLRLLVTCESPSVRRHPILVKAFARSARNPRPLQTAHTARVPVTYKSPSHRTLRP